MSYRITSAILLLCCAFCGTGCPGQTCTAIGCGGSFDIVITHGDGGELAAGEYTIEFTVDGELADTLSCVPGGTNECDGPPGAAVVFGSMDGSSITLAYAVADGDERPATVEVAVSFGGESLGTESFAPAWSVDYPNGEECEPACWSADDEEMEIARPSAE